MDYKLRLEQDCKKIEKPKIEKSKIDKSHPQKEAAELRNSYISSLMEQDDDSFRETIMLEFNSSLAINYLSSDTEEGIKFAVRAVKYLWPIIVDMEDNSDIISLLIDISYEWIDSNDFDLQNYLLDVRELLRNDFGIDFDYSSD